jgi:hypothetical protein
MVDLISKNNSTYNKSKVWNENCTYKRERLTYWNRFDRYFKRGINELDCRDSDFYDYVGYLNDNYEVCEWN